MLDEDGNMAGSMLVLRAASFDEARSIVENDPYYKGDVASTNKLCQCF